MGGEGGKEMNLILKIAQIDRLLYSPALIEACELHEQELFLKRFKKGKTQMGKQNTFSHQCKYLEAKCNGLVK